VQNYLEKVTAIYDYNADKEDELTFQVLVVIRVTYLQSVADPDPGFSTNPDPGQGFCDQ
jgi:hypothetical protein